MSQFYISQQKHSGHICVVLVTSVHLKKVSAVEEFKFFLDLCSWKGMFIPIFLKKIPPLNLTFAYLPQTILL
jgi:hypothetical protein